MARVYEFPWHDEETMTKRRECVGLPVFGQTQTFEPDHEIVGEKRQLRIEGIGRKTSRRSTPEWKIVFQNAEDPLKARPVFVKSEHAVRSEIQVGDDDRVGVFLQGEQSQFFIGITFHFSSQGDKAIGLFPALGLIRKLGGRKDAVFGMISKGGDFLFDWSRHLGDNREMNTSNIEFCHEALVIEP